MYILFQFIKIKIANYIKSYKMVKVAEKWRLQNQHNKTVVDNPAKYVLFPIDKVKVGRYTYGPLHVVPYNNSDGNLIIGSFCSIANGVKFLLGGNHDYSRFTTYPIKLITEWEGTTYSKGDIIVGDDVWIGENALILSGVRINQGAVIAANSVVTHDVGPYEIVGGNPLQHIKYRFSTKVIDKLLSINFDLIDEDTLRNAKEQFSNCLTDDNIDEFISIFNR